jgi:hypothetical protein
LTTHETLDSVFELEIVGATPAVEGAPLVAPVIPGDGEPFVVTSASVPSLASAWRFVMITVAPELVMTYRNAMLEFAFSDVAIFAAYCVGVSPDSTAVVPLAVTSTLVNDQLMLPAPVVVPTQVSVSDCTVPAAVSLPIVAV